MNIAPFVAQHVEEVVHGNWTDIYLDAVIMDVTYDEAITHPGGVVNTIAMLVNHLAFYNQVVIQRLNGTEQVIDESNGFNVSIHNEAEWQRLKDASLESFRQLAGIVRPLADGKIFGPTPNGHNTFYKTLHGIAEHAHYHLGQIVLLKKIIRYANSHPK